ncbi:MAG: preprotein translocase subunit SecG [Candidatus Hydrogenedentes bacterium]|nr:preprotein translocase subunit SecG [Candidatus Hydrogenedentota bacterium]
MFDVIFSLNTFWWICTLIWFPACVSLIVIVLLQKGKGAGFAGAFGMGGGSDAVFGPRSRKSLPVRLTYIMAGTFMVLSLLLSLIVGRISAGVAPAEVDEDAAKAAVNSAMDDLFGAESPASTTAPGVTIATPEAEPATAEAPAAATTEAAPAPVESAPAADAAKPAEPAPAAQ